VSWKSIGTGVGPSRGNATDYISIEKKFTGFISEEIEETTEETRYNVIGLKVQKAKWRLVMGRLAIKSVLPWMAGFLLGWAIFPSPALAFIPHWDPREAFFIRQFAYLAFMLSMLFFIYELKQGEWQQHRAFRLLAWASAFFALWNLDCFLGQFSDHFFPLRPVAGEPGSRFQEVGIADWANWVTYFTKLDHLFLVPAFVFFYLGIRALRKEQEVGKS